MPSLMDQLMSELGPVLETINEPPEPATEPQLYCEPPSMERIQSLWAELSIRYSLRNEMVRFWRSIIRLSRYYQSIRERRDTATTDDDHIVWLSLPASLVQTTIRRCLSQREIVQVALESVGEEYEIAAEHQEGAIAAFTKRSDDRYRASGGSNSLMWRRLRSLLEDGHLAERLLLAPSDDECPWRTEVLDIIDCYPVWGTNGVEAGLHVTKMQVREARKRWGADLLPDEDERTAVDVLTYYDSCWVASVVKNEWLKEPVEHCYGFVPLRFTFLNGTPGDGSRDDTRTLDEIEANRGRSIVADVAASFEEMVRISSAASRVITYNTNPAFLVEDRNGNTRVELDPGTVNHVPEGTKVTPIIVDVRALEQLQAEYALARTDIEQAIPVIGQGTGTSGFATMLLNAEANSYLEPILDTLAGHNRQLYQDALRLVRIFNMQVTSTKNIGRGRLAKWTIDPMYVSDAPYVSVRYSLISPAEETQKLAVGGQAVAAGLMDEETFWDKMMGEQDATEIAAKARRSLAMRNPAAQSVTAPLHSIETLQQERRRYEAEGNQEMAEITAMMMARTIDDLVRSVAQQPQQAGAMPQSGPAMPPDMIGQQVGIPMGGQGIAPQFMPPAATGLDPVLAQLIGMTQPAGPDVGMQDEMMRAGNPPGVA